MTTFQPTEERRRGFLLVRLTPDQKLVEVWGDMAVVVLDLPEAQALSEFLLAALPAQQEVAS